MLMYATVSKSLACTTVVKTRILSSKKHSETTETTLFCTLFPPLQACDLIIQGENGNINLKTSTSLPKKLQFVNYKSNVQPVLAHGPHSVPWQFSSHRQGLHQSLRLSLSPSFPAAAVQTPGHPGQRPFSKNN